METNNQNCLNYIEATKGMLKAERISFLIDLIEKNNHDFYVYFGSYYQFSVNKKGGFIKEPLLWKVMNHKTIKDDRYLLLLSKYLVDTLHFSYESNEYRTSTIRQALNESFYDVAFTKRHKKKIIPITIDDYTDNVFLLSKEDYENPDYFIDDDSRKASCTDYSIAFGGYQSKTTRAGTYWTRSKGASKTSKGVVIVNHYGRITSWRPYHKCPGWHRSFSSMAYETVRPAIRIKI
jgi:hypothetical protein